MDTRRDFLINSAMLAGSGFLSDLLTSVQKASAIEAEPGSSYLDAEHVVILMQENRSFDHCFGSLQGVRGFNDPRAIKLPDGNPVWVQTDTAKKQYVPFRLDMKETKATWMGSLPHSWVDQVDAANGGKHDRWLEVKKSGHAEYGKMPLTLGYYNREDLPCYYALADAFTICDQNFCSTLTGTTPNRLHLWTGTIREKPSTEVPALVRNEDCDYGRWASWKTFPERLEDAKIPWKIYQNEISLATGLTGEHDLWLANFTDNPIEWFSQFNVRLAPNYRKYLVKRIPELHKEIATVTQNLSAQSGAAGEKLKKQLVELKATVTEYESDLKEFTEDKYLKLSDEAKSLHARAFTTNAGDPNYRELTEHTYMDGDQKRTIQLPKGDVLHQFRKDVDEGKLPTVSWLVPPEAFSDHPSSAWFGQWYLSEVFKILTAKPEVWKKTIFILTYDENDGYFDHIPPFQAPNPKQPESGRVSTGIDASLEHQELAADRKQHPKGAVRGNSLGLGFRVPMIVASPWSRGGCVCSQVFDHTSVLQLLEKILSHKTGKKIEETNITKWRRTVCGDLTSVFQKPGDQSRGVAKFVSFKPYVENIHKAKFKKVPAGFHALTPEEIQKVAANPGESVLPRQEPGVRKSAPLPYQIVVNGSVDQQKNRLNVRFENLKDRHGLATAGTPFIVYAFTSKGLMVRNYALTPGDTLEDSWSLNSFPDEAYHLCVYGPNGFFREFKGSKQGAGLTLDVRDTQASSTGALIIRLVNQESAVRRLTIQDNSYGNPPSRLQIGANQESLISFETQGSHGWYDFSVVVDDQPECFNRFAGRVETGHWSVTDPLMGGV